MQKVFNEIRLEKKKKKKSEDSRLNFRFFAQHHIRSRRLLLFIEQTFECISHFSKGDDKIGIYEDDTDNYWLTYEEKVAYESATGVPLEEEDVGNLYCVHSYSRKTIVELYNNKIQDRVKYI